MAGADKLSLGLDDIIRAEGSTHRRGRGSAIRGSRGRGGGGGRGGSSGFRTRGGGGIVSSISSTSTRHHCPSFSLARTMHQHVVSGSTISSKIAATAIAAHNAAPE